MGTTSSRISMSMLSSLAQRNRRHPSRSILGSVPVTPSGCTEGADVNPAAVRSAAARIAGRVHRTPVRTSATLDDRTGAQVLAKATVVMPTYSPAAKVAACWSYGAEVILHGDSTTETFAECERLQRERGLTFVHPFDDPEIVAGQGTVGLELTEDAGPVDVWLVSVGGGVLCTGTSLAVRDANPACRVVVVEPEGAAALSAGLAAGRPVPIVAHSVADGLCA